MPFYDDLKDYADYKGTDTTVPVDTTRNILLLAIANSLTGSAPAQESGSTSSGGATEAKQNEAIALLDSGLLTSPVTPRLEAITNNNSDTLSGTLSGAKYAAFYLRSGTGSILGTAISSEDVSPIEFPLVNGGYSDITYTLEPGASLLLRHIDGSNLYTFPDLEPTRR